jgi:type I restriction enzyme M protein
VRWKYGAPPASNANYAWLQHIVHHLKQNGSAGVVLANGSMSSNQSGEDLIRKALVDADLVDCMVILPSQLFYSVQIPACLWFLAKDKNPKQWRNRSGEVLFIDARKMGVMVDRKRRELTNEDIQKITATYHAWRGENGVESYENIPGYCASAKLIDIQKNGYILTAGRYVGSEDIEDSDEDFEVKMSGLAADLKKEMQSSAELDMLIRKSLQGLGYEL